MFFKKFKKTKPITDAEYLAAFKASGNLELLAEVYEKYMEMVYAVCYKYLRDDEESKDAVMQIFEELIGKVRVHNIENFKSWLHTLARNYCLMALRKSNLQLVYSEDFGENFVENEPIVHQENETFYLERNLYNMDQCMDKLIFEQKTCIKMFYFDQRCYQEIAESTGFELNKVKSYIQNGKRNLKICIEKSNGKE